MHVRGNRVQVSALAKIRTITIGRDSTGGTLSVTDGVHSAKLALFGQ
jgi:hypothetical protein